MILCFSGTGNTLAAARALSSVLGDGNLHVFTADELRNPAAASFDCEPGGLVIWMFPTYSWGVPPVIAALMRQAAFGSGFKQVRHYMVTTCGDDTGYVERQWRKLLRSRGLVTATAYAVQMPNTYVFMKGFDVDSPELTKAKLDAMPGAISSIAAAILSGEPGDRMIRHAGSWFKSKVIYPFFVRHCMSPRPFRATDACTGCGACARACPMSNISMTDGLPHWGSACAFCLRCYHTCPRHAVAYGSSGAAKGQKRCL